MTILCFFRNNCENCFDRKNQFTVNPRRRWPPPQKLSTEHDGANGLRLRDLVYTEVGCARQSLKCGLVSVSLSRPRPIILKWLIGFKWRRHFNRVSVAGGMCGNAVVVLVQLWWGWYCSGSSEVVVLW